MLANIAKLALVTAAVTLLATSADAQRIHPRCVKVKDKVKCTCIFDNGGLVRRQTDGRTRAVLVTMGQVDRYIECMKRHGRA